MYFYDNGNGKKWNNVGANEWSNISYMCTLYRVYYKCQACVATKVNGHKILQFQPLDLPTSGSSLTLETIGG
jgi:hypothetical protein